MSVLSWGKCKIETTPSIDGAPGASASWTGTSYAKGRYHKSNPDCGN